MNSIVINDLKVRRGGNLVLPGISLEVAAGTVSGLLGPSGSGKTTLMRSIVGVQIVESGEVKVLGGPAGTPELRRRIGYVTQTPSVYGDLSVREKQVDQVVRTLSGGERTRASLATALLTRPELLVLDEPTVGLDPLLRRDLWERFHGLTEEGATLLVSSHDMDEAKRCDEIVLMRGGTIVATGEPKQLLETTGTDDLEEAFIRLAEES